MLTLEHINEKVENKMTVAEEREFEKSTGLTLDELFALANLNSCHRLVAEVLFSDYFEIENED